MTDRQITDGKTGFLLDGKMEVLTISPSLSNNILLLW